MRSAGKGAWETIERITVPAGWQPTFVDYHALPSTSRAKVLMMLESAISLVTIVVVASRAINILGS